MICNFQYDTDRIHKRKLDQSSGHQLRLVPEWSTFNGNEPVSAHSMSGPKHFVMMFRMNRTVALQTSQTQPQSRLSYVQTLMKYTYDRFASASTVGANQ